MIHVEVVITDPQGVHALVAQELARAASTFASSLFLRHQGRTARMDNPMSVLALGLRQGASVTIWADGDDEAAALARAVTLLNPPSPPPDFPLHTASSGDPS